jgi:hypothetical protein
MHIREDGDASRSLEESGEIAVEENMGGRFWRNGTNFGAMEQISQISLSRILFLCKFTWVWSLSFEASQAKKHTLEGTLFS